jgi:hypothetical protein
MKGETISVSIGQGAFTATHYNLRWQRQLQRTRLHVVPHVLRNPWCKTFTYVMHLMEKLISMVQMKTG